MNKKGFTLMEALIAIIILGFTLLITSRMQVGSLLRFGRWRSEIDRVYLIKKRLQKSISIYLKPGEKIPEKISTTKTYEQPQLKVSVEAKAISRKSSLSEYREILAREEAVGEWDEGKNLRSMGMVTFVLIPPGGIGEEFKRRLS